MRILLKKRKSIFHLINAAFFLLITGAHAQVTDPSTPKINIPSSPEAALFKRFGDIPIGYYTGTASITVPIYNVQEGGVNIPVQLGYHSSGIRVEDNATWVGLGWDLSPGGAIIQEIRGKADENDAGFACDANDPEYAKFKQRYQFMQGNSYWFLPQWGREFAPNSCLTGAISDPSPPAPWGNTYQDPWCVIDALLSGKGEPDIYSYDFAGHSGKFYIHPVTHQIVVIEKNDQVYFERINFNCFKATTLDGTIFTFADVETTNGGLQFEFTGKNYKLTNVLLLNGKQVDFTYADYYFTDNVFSESADVNHFGTGSPVNSNTSQANHYNKTLTKITTTDAIIDFNLEGREDINLLPTDNVKRLKSIDITSKLSGQKVKTFQFNYDYFPYNFTGVNNTEYVMAHADALGKRLKLNSVQEIGYDDNGNQVTGIPPYVFDYDLSVTMPMKISFAKDFWGYYNGKQNTRLLPDLDYFDYFNNEEYKAINQKLAYPYVGADRYADNQFGKAYLLKKVTYPTGGFTELEYEPNSFSNQFIPDASKNVHKFYDVQDNSIAHNSIVTFRLSKSTTLHFSNRFNNGADNYNGLPALSQANMQDCYIKLSKIKTINGSPVSTEVKHWTVNDILNVDFIANHGRSINGEEGEVRVDFDPDPSTIYELKVDFPDNLNNVLYASIAGVSAHVDYYDDTNVDVSESNQGGFRVKEVRSYTSAGSLASDKVIKYYNGKLLNQFHPLSVYKANALDNTYVTNGIGIENISFFKKITASGNEFGLSGGNPIGYGKVEEIEIAPGGNTNGKKVFYYNNQENKTHQDCPIISEKRNGMIAKEETYDDANTILNDRTYLYTAQTPFPEKFVAIRTVRLAVGAKVSCMNEHNNAPDGTWIAYYEGNGVYNASQYGYNLYTIDAEWWKLSQTISNVYSKGIVLTTTETNTYNSEGSLKTVTTQNSKNETLATKYFYPQDYLIDYNIDQHMVLYHNTSTPVITEQYNGSKLISRQRTVYGSVTGAPTILPQYIYLQRGTNPEELRMTINSYDEKGNVTQYTPENNIPVCILWNSDKTLPIAKIENASYASVNSVGLNAARASLPNARVTSFTYKPLIGVATVTDINNKTATYQYDPFGRLIVVKDPDGNVIKALEYHYK